MPGSTADSHAPHSAAIHSVASHTGLKHAGISRCSSTEGRDAFQGGSRGSSPVALETYTIHNLLSKPWTHSAACVPFRSEC